MTWHEMRWNDWLMICSSYNFYLAQGVQECYYRNNKKDFKFWSILIVFKALNWIVLLGSKKAGGWWRYIIWMMTTSWCELGWRRGGVILLLPLLKEEKMPSLLYEMIWGNVKCDSHRFEQLNNHIRRRELWKWWWLWRMKIYFIHVKRSSHLFL